MDDPLSSDVMNFDLWLCKNLELLQYQTQKLVGRLLFDPKLLKLLYELIISSVHYSGSCLAVMVTL